MSAGEYKRRSGEIPRADLEGLSRLGNLKAVLDTHPIFFWKRFRFSYASTLCASISEAPAPGFLCSPLSTADAYL